MEYFVCIKDKKYTIEFDNNVDVPDTIKINGKKKRIDFQLESTSDIVSLILNDTIHELHFKEDGEFINSSYKSKEITLKVETKREQMLRKYSESESAEIGVLNIVAPMPGLVVKVMKNEGEKVKKGEGVVIVEAMKMENEVKSIKHGIIGEIKVKEGDKVDKNQVMIIIR